MANTSGSYEERMVKARKAFWNTPMASPDKRDGIDNAIDAFLGDGLFQICPACNGDGEITTMAADPTLDQTVTLCYRCHAWSGMDLIERRETR